MPPGELSVRIVQPGRTFRSFRQGEVIQHRGEVTLDRGMADFWTRVTGQVSPLYTSERFARDLRFENRPVDPMLLFNLALSLTVDGVDGLSAQSTANLGYKDIRFYRPVYAGETFRVITEVVKVEEKPGKDGAMGRGIATFSIALESAERGVAMSFLRTNMFALEGEPRAAAESSVAFPTLPEAPSGDYSSVVPRLSRLSDPTVFEGGGQSLFGNLKPGQIFFHMPGVTLSDSEHMLMTRWLANFHRGHGDRVFCAAEPESSIFHGDPAVYGGLHAAYGVGSASHDLDTVVFDLGWADGFHRGPVKPQDTLFAATQIVETTPVEGRNDVGLVVMKQVVLNNARALRVSGDGDSVELQVWSRKHRCMVDGTVSIAIADIFSDKPYVFPQPLLIKDQHAKAFVGTRRALVLTGEPA